MADTDIFSGGLGSGDTGYYPGINAPLSSGQVGTTFGAQSADPSSGGGVFGTGLTGGQAFGLGAVGAGALGLGALIAKGPSPLPAQYGQLTGQQVPYLMNQADYYGQQSRQFTQQGQQALQMAQQGQLTAPQQASLNLTQQSLTNKARQMYYGMGRNPDQDTSFINETANIDAETTALAQKYIQSTIQLGLGETSAGAQFGNLQLSSVGQADQLLLAAGQAQLQADKQYSDSLTSAFSAVGSLVGGLAKVLAF